MAWISPNPGLIVMIVGIKLPMERDEGQLIVALLPLQSPDSSSAVPLISIHVKSDCPPAAPCPPGQTDYMFPAAAEDAGEARSGVRYDPAAVGSSGNTNERAKAQLTSTAPATQPPLSLFPPSAARVRVFRMHYPGPAPKNSVLPSLRVAPVSELLRCPAQSDSRSRETTTKDRSTGRGEGE